MKSIISWKHKNIQCLNVQIARVKSINMSRKKIWHYGQHWRTINCHYMQLPLSLRLITKLKINFEMVYSCLNALNSCVHFSPKKRNIWLLGYVFSTKKIFVYLPLFLLGRFFVRVVSCNYMDFFWGGFRLIKPIYFDRSMTLDNFFCKLSILMTSLFV